MPGECGAIKADSVVVLLVALPVERLFRKEEAG
jgi:hypothetical protein